MGCTKRKEYWYSWNKGYDGEKKISGIKRHIAVDFQGLPHAVHITTANIADRKGALEDRLLNKDSSYEVKSVLADGGYSLEPFLNGIQELLGCRLEIAKRNELHMFKVIFKRWVVESSFSWLKKMQKVMEKLQKEA